MLATQIDVGLSTPTPIGCRRWTGGADKDGYGLVTNNRVTVRVTHAVWYLNTGYWPVQRDVIAHKCDWPPCGEFTHLFLTNHAGNVADRDQKGRQVRGERQHCAKLTAPLVAEMRARYVAGGVSMAALGALYGVSYATARSAIKGEHWKHI